MVRKRKPKLKSKFPITYGNFEANDEIVYKRVSDDKMSIGVIKYFRLGVPVCAIVVDLQLRNFQLAVVDEIIEDPTEKLIQSLWSKVTVKTRHQAERPLRRGKTKKS